MIQHFCVFPRRGRLGPDQKEKNVEQPKYYDLFTLIEMIDEPNKSAIRTFVNAERETLLAAPGSVHNHQPWYPGGWWDHTTEAMNYAIVYYPVDPRPHIFSLSDLLLVLFLHDIEKPWKYEWVNSRWKHRMNMMMKSEHQAFRMEIAKKWHIVLTPEHINGIKYTEGEHDDYTPRERMMGQLASFAHAMDNLSARERHEYPLEKNDPWKGAHRIASMPAVAHSGARIAPDGIDDLIDATLPSEKEIAGMMGGAVDAILRHNARSHGCADELTKINPGRHDRGFKKG